MLADLQGVDRVRANATTGNVLVEYNPRWLDPGLILEALQDEGWLSERDVAPVEPLPQILFQGLPRFTLAGQPPLNPREVLERELGLGFSADGSSIRQEIVRKLLVTVTHALLRRAVLALL